MKRIKKLGKTQKGLILAALAVLLVFGVGWRYVSLPVYKLVVHEITKASEDSYISVTADINSTKSLTLGNEFVSETKTITVGSGTSSWDLTAADGNVIIFEAAGGVSNVAGTSASLFEVQLAPITSSIDGMPLILKNVSGLSSFVTFSGCTDQQTQPGSGYDTIEATQGTASGVSYLALDAAGDCTMFVADYSGTTSVWRMLSEDIG